MKFNAIVGNPPYQLMDGGAQSSATPVYNFFVNASKKIKPQFISLIIPSRWMTAGKGLDEFRMEMIHDKSIAILHDYINANECFTNVDIKGGVCYFLWQNMYNNPCDIYTHYSKDSIKKSRRFLSLNEESTFYVRDKDLLGIIEKVQLKGLKSFESIVSSRKPYGLCGDLFKDPSKYGLPELSNNPIENGYRILGLGDKQKREYKYISKNYPLPKDDHANELKIFIPESYGNGIMGDGPTNPIIGKPNDICTETFLQITPIANEIEARNIFTYMKSKFFRALVGITKNTQHGTQKVYRLVPLLDFSKEWKDKDLYNYFGLSDNEIRYIESLMV